MRQGVGVKKAIPADGYFCNFNKDHGYFSAISANSVAIFGVFPTVYWARTHYNFCIRKVAKISQNRGHTKYKQNFSANFFPENAEKHPNPVIV